MFDRDTERGAGVDPVGVSRLTVAFVAEGTSLRDVRGRYMRDSDKIKSAAGDGQCFGLPMERLAQEKAGNKLMANSVGTGAAVAMVGYDFELLARALRQLKSII